MIEGIIEESSSPWFCPGGCCERPYKQAQKKTELFSDNQYTECLPMITNGIVNNLAKYSVFSTFDLKCAYHHQMPIMESDKQPTVFEDYCFCQMPFSVTNGIVASHWLMDKLVHDEKVENTFPYLDNIMITEHDKYV